jgi:hypothetical protein
MTDGSSVTGRTVPLRGMTPDADGDVFDRIMNLQGRGCTFELGDGGRFRVVLPDRLTADDISFLNAHRGEAHRLLEYRADDSHLYDDRSRAGLDPIG